MNNQEKVKELIEKGKNKSIKTKNDIIIFYQDNHKAWGLAIIDLWKKSIEKSKMIKNEAQKISKIVYKYSKTIVKFILKVALNMIATLVTTIQTLFFGIIDAVYDTFIGKHHSIEHNLGKAFASGFVITTIIWGASIAGARTTTNVASALSPMVQNTTLTKSEQKDTEKAIDNLKKPVKITKSTNFTNSKLPNGDYMPTGVKYVNATALNNSPLSNGTIKGQKSFKIVNKLFTNATTQDQKFFNKIVQGAQIAGKSYGVNPSVIMAQAYIESGRGQSTLASKYNNYFGIKYRGYGSKVKMWTSEETTSGKSYRIKDYFQVYSNISESMADNARLIRYGISGQTNRYAGAWVENTQSYADATKTLTGTYATDINYNKTLNKVIKLYGLYVVDNHKVHNSSLKN